MPKTPEQERAQVDYARSLARLGKEGQVGRRVAAGFPVPDDVKSFTIEPRAVAPPTPKTTKTPGTKRAQGRGLGRIFQPRYRERHTGEWRTSPTWWVQYSFRGEKKRESSQSANHRDAVKLLKRRLGEMGQGHLVGPDAERVTFADLKTLLLDDYTVNGRRSLKRAKISVQHLHGAFGLLRAVDITGDRVTAYIKARQAVGARPATIQKETAALKRMFTLAIRSGKLTPAHRPYIESLEIHNTRTGFFEPDEIRDLLAHLPADVRPVVEFLSLTGWRIGEVLPLAWRQVDFTAGVVRLEPGTTKNGEGRTFPFTVLPPLGALLARQREHTDAVERAQERIIPSVFHRDGAPIKSLRAAWTKATDAAGLVGRIPHDFRRTAVRNLERAGVPRSVAMKLTGHLTESVYRRYAIVSEADLSAGVAKLAALHAEDAVHGQGRSARRVVALGSRTGKARAKQAASGVASA